MKKILSVFCFLFFSSVVVFGMEDTTHANALAKLGYITDWSNAPSEYRL